jgi:hypothetical protein
MRTDAVETPVGTERRHAELHEARRVASRPPARRQWHSGFVMLPLTVLRTFSMLRNCDLGAFVPFVAILFMCAGVLWIVNAIAPVAPLIYSLF